MQRMSVEMHLDQYSWYFAKMTKLQYALIYQYTDVRIDFVIAVELQLPGMHNHSNWYQPPYLPDAPPTRNQRKKFSAWISTQQIMASYSKVQLAARVVSFVTI